MLTKLQVKYIQSLNEKKFRKQEGVFVAEGPKIVKELLENGDAALVSLYTTLSWWEAAAEQLRERTGEKAEVIEAFELEKISFLSTPNQVLAVFKLPQAPASTDFHGRITLVLDAIQDPGNMGTLVRIADWFGIRNIVASPDCADVFNPKVVQSTMGSIARVEVLYEDLMQFSDLHADIPLIAATLHGTPLQEAGHLTEGFLLVGNESKGVRPGLLAKATRQLTIPRIGHAESLNAAVATGIILSHLLQVGG